MRTLPPACWSRPHAPITNASLTDMHAIVVDAFRLQLVDVREVARHVLRRARRRERARQAEDHDLLAACVSSSTLNGFGPIVQPVLFDFDVFLTACRQEAGRRP